MQPQPRALHRIIKPQTALACGLQLVGRHARPIIFNLQHHLRRLGGIALFHRQANAHGRGGPFARVVQQIAQYLFQIRALTAPQRGGAVLHLQRPLQRLISVQPLHHAHHLGHALRNVHGLGSRCGVDGRLHVQSVAEGARLVAVNHLCHGLHLPLHIGCRHGGITAGLGTEQGQWLFKGMVQVRRMRAGTRHHTGVVLPQAGQLGLQGLQVAARGRRQHGLDIHQCAFLCGAAGVADGGQQGLQAAQRGQAHTHLQPAQRHRQQNQRRTGQCQGLVNALQAGPGGRGGAVHRQANRLGRLAHGQVHRAGQQRLLHGPQGSVQGHGVRHRAGFCGQVVHVPQRAGSQHLLVQRGTPVPARIDGAEFVGGAGGFLQIRAGPQLQAGGHALGFVLQRLVKATPQRLLHLPAQPQPARHAQRQQRQQRQQHDARGNGPLGYR